MIDEKLVEILVCPATKMKLRLESVDSVRLLNEMISRRQLKTVNGIELTSQMEGILVREDGEIGYGIFDGIPNLLAEEGIVLPKK